MVLLILVQSSRHIETAKLYTRLAGSRGSGQALAASVSPHYHELIPAHLPAETTFETSQLAASAYLLCRPLHFIRARRADGFQISAHGTYFGRIGLTIFSLKRNSSFASPFPHRMEISICVLCMHAGMRQIGFCEAPRQSWAHGEHSGEIQPNRSQPPQPPPWKFGLTMEI